MVAIGFQEILHRKIGMPKNKFVFFITKVLIHIKSDNAKNVIIVITVMAANTPTHTTIK